MRKAKELSWRKLNDILSQMSEEEVLMLLNEERTHGRRASVLQRLHQRYTMLRCARERIELMREAVLP
jgi:hypothetical protein